MAKHFSIWSFARACVLCVTLLLLCCIGSACGGEAAPATASTQIVAAFADAGIVVNDVQATGRRPGSPLPEQYLEHLTFAVPRLAPRGGQVFVCDSKRTADLLRSHFLDLANIAGPYVYQSAGGTIVAHLDSGLTPDEARQFAAIIEALPQ